MIKWGKDMKSAFGASFLWLICLVYFTQGFRSFVWTAVSYQLKDRLQLSPSASQLLFSVAFFPWSIKPLYGLYSYQREKKDPILGYSYRSFSDSMAAFRAKSISKKFSGPPYDHFNSIKSRISYGRCCG